ncbi:hypothetical protein IX293_002170 [Fusobacterium necrophorum]|nr:O-antigen polymerase [Fusobacterium necrophorum]MBR8823895.1 hypothetical protein [Fusobacterium necrophorum]
MIYILFIGILLLFFFSYAIFNKNILNPSVIICSVFLVSTFFSILNIYKWNINFSIKTVLVVWITLIFFIFGNTTVKLIKFPMKKNYNMSAIYPISLEKIFLLNIFLMMFLYKYFHDIYDLSLIGGNVEGYRYMLKYAKIARLNFNTVSKVSAYGYYIAKSISYILIYMYSFVVLSTKKYLKYLYLLSPILIYLAFIFLSTTRTPFIYLIIYSLIVYFILYQKFYGFNRKLNRKIIFYSIVGLISFFIAFIAIGVLSGNRYNYFNIISIYTGSSITALNTFLETFRENSNNYFGENTFIVLYRILNKLGVNIPRLYPHYEFITLGNMTTNIYTGIRRYLEDFGMLGLLTLMFLYGQIYGLFFKYICINKKSQFSIILYATFSYPVFMFSIDELFFRELFPMNLVYDFIFLSLVYYLIISRIKNINKKNRKEVFYERNYSSRGKWDKTSSYHKSNFKANNTNL